MQPDPTDTTEHYTATEALQPDDVYMETHDERQCHLPVEVCPPCSAAERNVGPVYDWMVNPEAYEIDVLEPEPEPEP